jgi:cell division initiation protein
MLSMEVSPKTLREVEFREKMRGYHPEDVDQFLERVAASVEVLQDRLRQAVERAQRAEQAAAEAGGTDEALRRTLVLAQRTADLAVQEAREQAARILASAEQQAQGILADADERAQRAHDDALVEARAELTRLEASRTHLQAEVDTLTRWVEEHRAHLALALQEALSRIEQADLLSSPPVSRGVEPSASRAAAGRPGAVPTPETGRAPGTTLPEADSAGPATVAWQAGGDTPQAEGAPAPDDRPADPPAEGDPYIAELRRAVNESQPLGPREDEQTEEAPPDPADNDFFDQDVGDSRRLGRLRRRH